MCWFGAVRSGPFLRNRPSSRVFIEALRIGPAATPAAQGVMLTPPGSTVTVSGSLVVGQRNSLIIWRGGKADVGRGTPR